MPRRGIVVGVDGSDASLKAARYAAVLARELGVALVVVFVRESAAALAAPAGVVLPDVELDLDAELDLMSCLTATLDPLGVDWTLHLRSGEPAAELELAARATEAKLLVVGGQTRGRRMPGRSGFSRLAGASVSRALVRRGTVPVLVVH
jgi:nucleotide-binding universal stress UspA family protein